MKEFLLTLFLKDVKEMTENGHINIYDTEKNIETFSNLRRELGITYIDFQEEIKEVAQNLTLEDYCQGPKEDDNKERGKYFWIFGKTIFGKEMYLKFTKEDTVICWSCHFPEYEMKYPYKGGN